jgi:hypothetical protein
MVGCITRPRLVRFFLAGDALLFFDLVFGNDNSGGNVTRFLIVEYFGLFFRPVRARCTNVVFHFRTTEIHATNIALLALGYPIVSLVLSPRLPIVSPAFTVNTDLRSITQDHSNATVT